jgi:hypothetical protein
MTHSRIATVAVFAALAALLALPSAPALAVAPPNDDLAAAQAVPLYTNISAGNNADATLEGSEPAPACQPTYNHSVWFKNTATSSPTITADTEGSLFDTVLAVYSGPAVNPTFGTLVAVACDDDSGPGTESRLSFVATAGTTYYFQLASFNIAGSPRFRFGIAPPNDDLASAVTMVVLGIDSVNTSVATVEGSESSSFCGERSTVWYKFTALSSGQVAVNTFDSDFDTSMSVHASAVPAPGFLDLAFVDCNDDAGGGLVPGLQQSGVTFFATNGTTYAIQVGGYTGATGNLNFLFGPDGDADLIVFDNCPLTANGPNEHFVLGTGNQTDSDGDAGGSPPPGANFGGDACDVDDDNDGLPDTMDFCRTLAEDYDGWQDEGGCPDTDNDGDGVCDPGMFSVSCAGSDFGRYCFDPAGTLSCSLTDCRNAAEDHDAFKDSDGCPEPDNDNDGYPDIADNCPGANLHTGPDGLLGSAQDLNHSGTQDGVESPLTTDDVFKLQFEDYDGVVDIDGCHDSPGEDFDGDGYTDEDEALSIGTDAGYPCGINGWPSNLNDDGFSFNRLDILDVTSFVAPVRHFEKSPGDPGFDARWDIRPGAGGFPKWINITDITTLTAGPTGNPPMLGGARAFDRDCPFPP